MFILTFFSLIALRHVKQGRLLRMDWWILHLVSVNEMWGIIELIQSTSMEMTETPSSILPISAGHVGEPGPGEITILSKALFSYK